MSNPLLTIVLVNYNYAHYLPQAFQGILQQNLHGVEVLIYDDCSTDESCSLIEAFCTQIPDVRFIKSPQNRGVIGAINTSLEFARGKYIHYLASDDYYAPKFVEKHLEALLRNPWAGMSTCDLAYFFDKEPDQVTTLRFIPELMGPTPFPPEQMADLFRTTFLKIGGRQSVIKTELLRAVGGFDPKLQAMCDWFAYLQIALLHGAIYIPEVLIYERKHSCNYASPYFSNSRAQKKMYTRVMKKALTTDNPLLKKRIKTSTQLAPILKTLALRNLFFPKTWCYYVPPFFKLLKRHWG